MNDIKKDVLKKVNIDKKETLIISVSGGIDSMVLLDIFSDSKYKLVVVNFNHQKRSDSILDKDLVYDYCYKKGIIFEYIKLKIDDSNFHQNAHNKRKFHLMEIADKYQTKYILTAHHLDDLLETILIKFTRGSNLFGYAGMQEYTENSGYIFVKPLLFIPKERINIYAKNNGIKYLDDFTNDLDIYQRNRFRHHVIPLLKKENPNILNQAIAFNKQLTDAFNYIRESSISFLKGKDLIDINEFKHLNDSIKSDVLVLLLEKNDIQPNFELVTKLLMLIGSKKPNITYRLLKNRSFEKTYSHFSIIKDNKTPKYDIKVNFDEEITLNNVTLTFFNKKGVFIQDCVRICYNELTFPLRIRNRLNGDVLHLSFGHKKLKDFLIDKKIPKQHRDDLPVVTDANDTIIFIPGVYINKSLGDKNELFIKIGESNNAKRN